MATNADRLVELATEAGERARDVRLSLDAVASTKRLIAHGSRSLYAGEDLAATLTERKGWVRRDRQALRRVARQIAELQGATRA